ncbi:bifunctional DNA primase/polymerase [Actimicrobium antarcticum]|uniref:AAA family ATPase n=1 Tax=Actimicrobium antarcticum TaxID=1051899 RepID=A0ABP7TW92_9BURK
MSTLASTALRYAELGFPIFPLQKNSKAPLRGSQGFKDASNDPARAQAVWGAHPEYNIGLRTGFERNGKVLIAIDVDPRNGGDDTLEKLIAVHGHLPDTAMALTGGGGHHFLFWAPLGIEWPSTLGTGIDIKGRGGYVVAAPSVHPNGTSYEWEASSDLLEGQAIADMPRWVIDGHSMDARRQDTVSTKSTPARAIEVPPETVRDLRSALLSMRADDRALWVDVGHALKELGEVGRGLFMEWAATSAKFNPRDAADKWDSFNPEHTGYKAVFAKAQSAGWVNPTKGKLNLPVPADRPNEFRLLSGAELCALPPMRWMLRGVLPLEGLAALYGPSGSGKSFLILDIAAAIAGGDSAWFGRRVTQCPVTYCALEGEAGMGKRIHAWSLHHKKPVPDSLKFVIQSVDLMGGGDVAELASAIHTEGGNGGLVILDTLNRAAPGADENSSVDMGLLIAASKRLQGLTGGLVLLVHHTGKDTTKGLRGHSSLYAALDAAIEVNRNDSRREWLVAKSKDDETGAAHGFKLEIVPLGFDDAGDEVTSCAICPDEVLKAIQRVKLPAKGNQKIALDTLGEPLRKSAHFGKEGSPAGHPCIRLDGAIELVAEHMICDSRHKTTRARESLRSLVASGIYGAKGDWLWRV